MPHISVDHEVLEKNISTKWVKGTEVTSITVEIDRTLPGPRVAAENLGRQEVESYHEHFFGEIRWDSTVITIAHSTGRVVVELAVAPEGR